MTIKEPNYVEGLARVSGLTWRGLASRLGVNCQRRPGLRLPAGPDRQRESGGNVSHGHDGHGS